MPVYVRVDPDDRRVHVDLRRPQAAGVDLLELELERLDRQRREPCPDPSRSAPASISAPSAMSPEMPAMQSK